MSAGPVLLLRNALGLLIFMSTSPLIAQNWTSTSAPTTNWHCIASSADGQRIVAGGHFTLHTSTNAGATWTAVKYPFNSLVTATSSSDGSHLAVGSWHGSIHSSTNFGGTWINLGQPVDSLEWIASSADGKRLVGGGRNVCISTNAGLTWITTSLPLLPYQFPNSIMYSSIASSADGTKLVALVWGTNYGIFTSVDSGDTWTRSNAPTNGYGWYSVASSADGNKLVATKQTTLGYGEIYVSSDCGTNWTQTGPTAPSRWRVASSDDGSRLYAASSYTNGIYMSYDSGATWTKTDAPSEEWTAIACSGDGSIGMAVVFGGGPSRPFGGLIYTGAEHPYLNILKQESDTARISWPHLSSAAGFRLQQNSNFNTVGWVDVFSTVTITNDFYQTVVALSQGNQFFRLRKSSQ